MDKKYVAEVWLEWEICTGSTMYRQRFRSKRIAAVFAKLAAVIIDFNLPTAYRAEYSNGKPYYEKYGFDIRYGVREITDYEKSGNFTPVWSTDMPGTRKHKGEHREAHPLNRTGLDEYKL